MIKEAIIKIVDKQDLTYDEAYQVMDEIMDGKTTAVQNSAFLAALSTKSAKAETIDEISGCAAAMRDHALKVDHGFDTLEIVGTGGDGSHSFNISTTSAFVIAASGIKVSKHGNRAASSSSGAADVLEALGVDIVQPPEKAAALLRDVGMCFLFAQTYHSSMKYVGSIRKELGIRTVFNILGPLTNPAHPSYQVMGVYDEYLVEPLAHVLSSLGVKKGMVVYGQDRMDEISCSAPTTVCEIDGGRYETYEISPGDFGIETCRKEDVGGGSAQANALITTNILKGARGPRHDIVLLNSAAGLYCGGKADSMEDGIDLARKLIDDGAAYGKLTALKEASNL
ncbi:Anthranilate phosphoribosyltransferase [Candidatus Methanomethylophilus alvi Mx1201]|uniref:Anthranilate phosphoribosyltransferase n=2 Tax=Methanomethylophilus alvi TaxID=1291540 RepID=M9SJH2_METAX|nr:anthranilate phosphoribosyltransferase [Methanomethylophilus alvi]AGI85667.1 Anthranilate phosphoribosyltransferase [Candidatus Methanomethylophilus alvi Mx1201]AYQ55074.1 anthranilate phosphoribosyltransferase [Methanomethylophilus alvi]MCI5973589.1 anthranilate phosphoribosyltransferase [Methanomethylophilus alvi]MDD7479861.1 anthranilate phosphoribosyltransferase [Methanomethylophilus alvi]MDY7061218.1 anthranilate phosphoribosyltransferase [Methanomethylophilus alvi]